MTIFLVSKEELHQKIMDSFDESSFIQNASQDLIQAKANLVSHQSDTIENSGTIEIAEFMRNFLTTNLLTKQIRLVLQIFLEDKNLNSKKLTIIFLNYKKNLQVLIIKQLKLILKLEKIQSQN